jgi:SAM-dependent methyltransferase
LNFDADRFKREERIGYNLIAARYAESAVLRSSLNVALLDAADLRPGQAVLDLASGPGVLAREAARKAAGGLVVASDIAEQALAEGRRREPAGSLQFAAADAERLAFADGAFDRVLCGLGLMFFPDVPRALAEMRRVLKPGGLAVFSVWGEEARAPLVSCALQCIRRILPPPKAERLSPFRFGEPRSCCGGRWKRRASPKSMSMCMSSAAPSTRRRPTGRPSATWPAARRRACRACPRRRWRGWAMRWRRNWRPAGRARAMWRKAKS